MTDFMAPTGSAVVPFGHKGPADSLAVTLFGELL